MSYFYRQELREERKLRSEATEQARVKDFQLKDLLAQLEESEKGRKRLEGDTDGVTSQVLRLRHDLTELVCLTYTLAGTG